MENTKRSNLHLGIALLLSVKELETHSLHSWFSSAAKARGVLESEYYIEKTQLTVYAMANWIKFYKISILQSTIQTFPVLKITQSTTPHYLWAFGKNQKCAMTNQQLGRSVTSYMSHMHWVKYSIIDQWNQHIQSQAPISLHCCYDDMMNSHAWFMLMRHVCLWRKTLHDNPEGKHVKFHSDYLSSYLRQTTRYFNSFIFFLEVLGCCALEKNCKNHMLSKT